jgi:phage tail-like protein
MTTSRVDPYRVYNFRLEIDQFRTAPVFSSASGLTSTGTAVPYRTGADVQQNPRQLLGMRSYGPIVLTRGLTADTSLWDWYNSIANGVPDRRNGSVILMDESRADVLRWDFEGAWPNTITGPTLDAAANTVALEVLSLVVEGIVVSLAGS